ncbi:enoyl-CoA hydratase/isomerase family protein [Roseivirga echinicomitans]
MTLVKYAVANRIATITLNRPEKRNALNAEMVTQLKQAFTQAEQDENAKVIVLEAAGDSFCAGADLAYLQQLQSNTFEENLADSNHLKELFLQIYQHPKIVIAKIQGHAIAGGCGLATVCDFSFTIPEAKFGYTEVRIGFIPAIVKVFLLRKIGEGKAKTLLLTGELIPAVLAESIGLVNTVVEAIELDTEVANFAQMLVEKNSGQSMTYTKQMIAAVQSMGLEEGLNYAAEMNAKARASVDCQMGIAAFLNKEKIVW